MLSFKSIAVFATLAFGAMTSLAAPLLDDNHVDVNALVARCGCKSVPSIVSDVTVAVSANIDLLTYIKPENCTVEVLTPIIGALKVTIAEAVVEVNALIGESAEVILANVDATAVVTVSELAVIVGDLLVLIFTALGVVLDVCASASLSVVISLLCTLGEAIGALVCAILSVCAGVVVGLDVAVLGCIGGILSIIVHLNVNVLISILGISL